MHFAYLLRCADGSCYAGYTTDPARREQAHNRGTGAKYTRTRRPVQLARVWAYPDKSAAMGQEWRLKQLTHRQKEELLQMNEFETILSALDRREPACLLRHAQGKAYVRGFVPQPRLILLGGGHVAQPVCALGAQLGFDVCVADDRPAFANTERFPQAARVVCDSFETAIRTLTPRQEDYVCVLTRGHRWDAQCLRALLAGPIPTYLGMIGSHRRVAGLRDRLEAEGFDRQVLDSIHAPIGLDIGAVTPQEIAVSICAQLIQHRHSLPRQEGLLLQTDINRPVLEFLARADRPRAMLLVLEATGSTPAKPGALMAVDKLGTALGTIGGGCSEAEAMTKARRLIGTGGSQVITVEMTADAAAEEGMVCGGTLQVLIEDVSP